ncbi:hypothetical protein FRC12_021498 [Ceratobasidium sp. 428]|nr:hypothetical protein FRC12_021498 [Ceratobasidium sp. 428]
MSNWQNKTCRIFSDHQPEYQVIVFGNSEDEGTPVACVANKTTPQGLFKIIALPGADKFELKSVFYEGWRVGANPENFHEQNWPITTAKDFAWAIEPAGHDQWKIHLPNEGIYWYLPSGPDEQSDHRILLQTNRGRPGELWRIVPDEE